MPIENAAMPDRTVIQWDKHDLEDPRLFKGGSAGAWRTDPVQASAGDVEGALAGARRIEGRERPHLHTSSHRRSEDGWGATALTGVVGRVSNAASRVRSHSAIVATWATKSLEQGAVRKREGGTETRRAHDSRAPRFPGPFG